MSGRPALTAEEFVTALRAGDAALIEERRVTGAVILRGAALQGPIRALYVFFEGEVDFSDSTFDGGLDLSGCTFAKSLSLRNTRVDGDLTLDSVQVRDSPSLWDQRLPDLPACHLAGAVITGDLTITRTVIAGKLVANTLEIGGSLVISGTEIDNGTNLSNSAIRGDLSLGGWASSYERTNPLVRVGGFNGGITATNLRVQGAVDLHGVHVDGNLLLWGGVFESSIFARPLITSQQAADGAVRITSSLPVVTGDLSLAAARVTGHVQLNSLRVGGDIEASSIACGPFLMRPDRRQSTSPPCEVGRLLMDGARVSGDVSLPMLKVTGLAKPTAGRRGVLIHNAVIDGNLGFWAERAFSGDTEAAPPAERDGLRAGAVVSGDLEIRGTTVSGGCFLTNVWTSGAVRFNDSHIRGDLTFRSRTMLLKSPATSASARDRLRVEPSPLLRARAGSLDLTMVRCDNEIDLTGLDLVEESTAPASSDPKPGSVVARSVRAEVAISLFARLPVGDVVYEDFAGIPGAADFEKAQTPRLSASSHCFQADRARVQDLPRIGLNLSGAKIGELSIQPLPRRRRVREWISRRPGLRFPTPVDLRDLAVDVWSVGTPASAHPFLLLLESDPVFRRDTFMRIERNLRDVGHEAAATKLYNVMHRRERAVRWRDASRWPGLLGRWPMLGLGQLLTYGPYSRLMGFGTAPLRLLVVIGVAWAAMLPAYYVPANFEQSLEMRIASRNEGPPLPPPAEEWRGGTPFFASMRYHVPVVGTLAHDEWELAGGRGMCWSRAGKRCVAELPITPENCGVLLTILNWALWPLVLTFTIRKLLR